MEKLGIKFSMWNDFLERIDKAGICVLPLFHPAMKNVGPIRKDLAAFFNMLGPMVNPSFSKKSISRRF
jgi:anthranilate phosphoribosyltransferase